ncbi:MAG: NUDIX domain-containing protein [Lachnospiraceae bacterium]|nr:NUDIX domain-containing protein [Lachnospiraceae bacterium]
MELIDLRNEDGSLTGKVKERSEIHRDGDLHGTVHVWLIRYREGRQSAEVLLQKRSAHKDSFPGSYDISSAGHVPAGTDFLESAQRELEEELGIKAEKKDLHHIFSHIGYKEARFYGRVFKNYEYSQVYLYECALEPEEMKLQEEEVESVLWIDYQECLKRIRGNEMQHCIFQDEFEELSKKIQEYVINKKERKNENRF